MFFKLLLSFLFLSTLLSATNNYPKTYSKLGTLLFSAVAHFTKYENIDDLKLWIYKYKKETDKVLLLGLKADTSNDKDKRKAYLKKLRKLQALYEKLLHELHKSISKSIKNDDYKLFLELTSYAFNGLFTNTNLRNQAIAFYSKHKYTQKHKCIILEKKMADEALSKETKELFAAEIIHSSYDSNAKTSRKKSVDISLKRVQNRIKVSFYNKNIYDVTIKVNSSLNNISLKNEAPKEFVIKAKSTYDYGVLILGSGESQDSFSWNYTMGSKYAEHDDSYNYRLPFTTGSSHVVSQGYNGKDTHKGSSAYSIDFPMPIGTKIYAAQDGVVVKTKSNSDRGGYDKKYASSGNFVRILHNDGTFATYYHLKYNGVIVNKGDKVFKGKALGYSKNTGYTSGPHLHFSVFKAVSSNKIATIPTKILTSEGIISEPLVGHLYKAK